MTGKISMWLKKSSKAQLQAIPIIFGILLAGIGIFSFSLLKLGGYSNVNAILKENEVERKAIILAQIFSSLPNLTYSNGEISYRSIFSKDKVDKVMMKQAEFLSSWKEKLYPNLNLSEEVSYPDSYSILTLIDLENDEKWIVVMAGPEKKFKVKEFVKCLAANLKYDINKLFDLEIGPWEVFDVDSCTKNFENFYNVTIYYSKSEISFYGLPVSIKSSAKETSPALLKVWMVEV